MLAWCATPGTRRPGATVDRRRRRCSSPVRRGRPAHLRPAHRGERNVTFSTRTGASTPQTVAGGGLRRRCGTARGTSSPALRDGRATCACMSTAPRSAPAPSRPRAKSSIDTGPTRWVAGGGLTQRRRLRTPGTSTSPRLRPCADRDRDRLSRRVAGQRAPARPTQPAGRRSLGPGRPLPPGHGHDGHRFVGPRPATRRSAAGVDRSPGSLRARARAPGPRGLPGRNGDPELEPQQLTVSPVAADRRQRQYEQVLIGKGAFGCGEPVLGHPHRRERASELLRLAVRPVGTTPKLLTTPPVPVADSFDGSGTTSPPPTATGSPPSTATAASRGRPS